MLRGSEAEAGTRVLPRGRRLRPAELALLAAVGKTTVAVYRQPRVAILPTGGEVLPVNETPQWFQIRNSNAVGLAAQVTAAGGVPVELGIAADRQDVLREMVDSRPPV